MRLRRISPWNVGLLLGLALTLAGARLVRADCTATSDCNSCGPCCGSSGCSWTPRCGIGGGQGGTCQNGNCCYCAACCLVTQGGEIFCSCAKCPSNPICPACPGSFASVRASGTHATVQPRVHGPSDIAVDVFATDSSLVIDSMEITHDRDAWDISFQLVNDGSSPISAYILSWKLSGPPGTQPLLFSSFFDSAVVGEPISPGATVADAPHIGGKGPRLRSVEAEVVFVELADGRRFGTAADELGAVVDTKRQELKTALRSYASTFRDLGSAGLSARLRSETTARSVPTSGSTPAHAVACAPDKASSAAYVLQLLGPERLAQLLKKRRDLLD